MLSKIVHLFSFLLSYLCVFCHGECILVHRCSDSLSLQVGGLSYELSTGSWKSDKNSVCPRSDDSVPYWLVSFEDSAEKKLTTGTFCTETTTSALFDVCNMNGTLVFVMPDDFNNKTGNITFTFTNTSTTYNADVTVRFASTGVYPEKDVVYFQPFTDLVELNYYIYSPDSTPDTATYYNGILLTNNSFSTNPKLYDSFPDMTRCISSSSSESTTFFQLFLINPSAASAGEYVLQAGSFSATVTLELNVSPSSTSVASISSVTLLLSSSVQATDTSYSLSNDALHPSPSYAYSSFSSSPTLLPPTLLPPSPSFPVSPSTTGNINPVLPATLASIPFLVLVIVVVITIIVIIVLKRKRIESAKNQSLEEKGKSTAPPESGQDGNCNRKAMDFFKQYSEDPSLHKVCLHPNQKDPSHDTKIVIEMADTRSAASISEEQSIKDSRATSPSSSLSKSFPSVNEVDSVVENTPRIKNPRVASLQKTGNGYSYSFPCTPKTMGRHQLQDDELAATQSSTDIEMRKQTFWLEKIYKEVKKNNKIGEKGMQYTKQAKELQEEGVGALHTISGTLEHMFVSDQDPCVEEDGNGYNVHVSITERK